MAIIRINFNAYEEGEEYRVRLFEEAERNFKVFLTLLSSYWQTTIDGPNYAREIKAMSIELARIRISLDDVLTDQTYSLTRGEFLYQVLTSVLFPQESGAPDPRLADSDFRSMLLKVVSIYLAGSIPDSMKKAVELFVNGQVRIIENYLEARKPGSGFDISDQFGFGVDVILDSPGATDVFLADKNIRILLNIIRPAHTLYRPSFILRDTYVGQQDPSVGKFAKASDTFSFILANYGYEDSQEVVEGIDHVDLLGFKKAVDVVGEDHSADFLNMASHRSWAKLGRLPGPRMWALGFMRVEKTRSGWRAWDVLRVPEVRPTHPTTVHPTLREAKKHCEGIVLGSGSESG